jgi:hypothetical protein
MSIDTFSMSVKIYINPERLWHTMVTFTMPYDTQSMSREIFTMFKDDFSMSRRTFTMSREMLNCHAQGDVLLCTWQLVACQGIIDPVQIDITMSNDTFTT